jgi:hypothetical protein
MKDLDAIVSQAINIVTRVVSVALLLLIASTVAGHYGFRAPMLPRIDATPLAWLCGAFWLYRGGRIG